MEFWGIFHRHDFVARAFSMGYERSRDNQQALIFFDACDCGKRRARLTFTGTDEVYEDKIHGEAGIDVRMWIEAAILPKSAQSISDVQKQWLADHIASLIDKGKS